MNLSVVQKERIIDRMGQAMALLVGFMLLVVMFQNPSKFFELTTIGISNGALIALIALGYTMVYGIIELINFAHADVFMIGAMLAMQTIVWSGTTDNSGAGAKIAVVLLAMLICMVACAAINVFIERIAYRPLRNAPPLAPLITAIGMSFIVSNVGQKIWGPSQINVPDLLPNAAVIGSLRVKDVFVIGVTIPLLLALSWFVKNTRQGKAMRATAQDQSAAAIMGIDVNRTIALTFTLGGLLAGASGMLFALFNTTTVWSMGFTNGLLAFTAAVLGGIGNLTGAVLGGVAIGLLQSYAGVYIGARWTEIIVFSVLILVLVFRPTGILGEQSVARA